MIGATVGVAVALVLLSFAVIFHAIVQPNRLKAEIMQISDLVTALTAVTAQLTPLPGQISAAIAAGDATALATIDQPVADLQAAVTALVAAIPVPTA